MTNMEVLTSALSGGTASRSAVVAATVATLSALGAGYWLAAAAYSLTLHPLSGFPGPRLMAVSRMPWWWACIRGAQVSLMQKLHARYGSVVRFSPNDLSFVDEGGEGGEAWQELHGSDKSRPENPKAREFFGRPYNGVETMVSADYDDHRRYRRLFAPAFSERALDAQQPLFRKHVDLMVRRLRELGAAGKPVEMTDIFNFTTFDIMGDLTFGQSLGLLENAEWTPWARAAFDYLTLLPYMQILEYYPVLKKIFGLLEPRSVRELNFNHYDNNARRVDERLARGSDRPDIWNLVLSASEGKGLSVEEMHSNGALLMVAGSETTATLLCGLVYYLLRAPEKLAILTDEIRAAFTRDDDIDVKTLADLKYLNACIWEGLRVYPPLPLGVPRYVPEGYKIRGRFVPANTCVIMQHYATFHSPANFRDPDTFAPARWLGDPEYAGDHLGAVRPFSVGPRNCIGQNMALHEARLILAKLLFNFDLELCDESRGWEDQRVFVIWEKHPLLCRLAPVAREG